ncbi:MAG: hypothetical protein AABX89_02380 [Candidatus Thermoplasmatota archaeon]
MDSKVLPRLASALVALALAAALCLPVQAGTLEVPEVADPANDQKTPGGAPTCPQGSGGAATTNCFLNADLLAGWIDSETADQFLMNIKLAGTGASATLGTAYIWSFKLTSGATDYDATVRLNGVTSGGAAGPLDGALTVSGVANSATIADGVISIVVLKSAVGSPTAGSLLTKLFVTVEGHAFGQNAPVVSDRAPDGAAFGTDYAFAGGGAAAGNGTADGNVTAPLNSTASPGNGTASPGSNQTTAPSAAPSASTSTTSSAGASSRQSAAADGASSTAPGKKTPGPGLLLVGLALAAPLWATRRRQS